MNDFPMLLKHFPQDEKPRERFMKYIPAVCQTMNLLRFF